jgi:hypothetical protein
MTMEAKPRNLFVPVTYVLTCSPDELTVEGFSQTDIQQLFDWQDKKVTLTEHEIVRMRRLEMLVLRTVSPGIQSQYPPGT